ncbi:hypothetical protein FRB99_002850 [Tulasnella sp. 403]|nr:hypothetical protein FRB99_002850 [Tulasnella sp. 403]
MSVAPSSSSTSSSSTTETPLPMEKKKETFLPPHIATYFIAGGIAGATSRSVVSPLERLKIIQSSQSDPVMELTMVSGDLWFECGKKKLFTKNGTKELDTLTRLTAGALAGITSVCSTYPLDLIRARLSIISASLQFAQAPQITAQPALATSMASPPATSLSKAPQRGIPSASLAASLTTSAASRAVTSASTKLPPKLPGMWEMLVIVYKEEGGIRGLYRGLVPTAVGVAPYVGINFTAYETLRIFITPPEHKNSIPRKLLCGALAGSISQTITYPLDVLRRKMQVVGMKATSAGGSLGYQYNGAWDAVFTIIKTEGVRGMYRGLWPNLLKVAPSIATSFFTYELVKEALI